MTAVTANSLGRYFEDRLAQADRYNMGGAAGNEPQFPMCVIYLGDRAAKAHETLAGSLGRMWPQYYSELCFFGLRKLSDGVEFFECGEGEGGDLFKGVDESRVRDAVSALFGLSAHFRDRSKMLVYYVMETTDFGGDDDLTEWLLAVECARDVLSANQKDALVILLNEDFNHQAAAKGLRNSLCGIHGGKGGVYCPASVFLISNRRSDNVILEDWGMCYRMLAALVALSNNGDPRAELSVNDKGIKTVGYAREEKPSAQIGQVIVCCMIDELNAGRTTVREARLPESGELIRKLGISKDGTVAVLDAYAEEVLTPLLPAPAGLELFPRYNSEEHGPLAELSYDEFNRLTMGAWDCFLSRLTDQSVERAKSDAGLRGRWQDAYARLLSENFSADELIRLADHIDALKGYFGRPRTPTGGSGALAGAGDRLKHVLSASASLTGIFLEVIERQGKEASAFIEQWTKLLRSRLSMFGVTDANMRAFYERKARSYFDRHGNERAISFKKLRSVADMEQFLKQTLDEIIESDDIFHAPFEEELELRLSEEAMPVDAKTYIRQKLTDTELCTYLQINFSLGVPIMSSMLLKRGTPLHISLAASLDKSVYYYDTGSGSAAETLIIYPVSKDNLING